MQIKFLISLIFAFLMGILAIQNSQIIEVNFLFLNFKIPQSALIIGILIAGIIIAVGFGVFKELKYKKIIKHKNKKIARLKKEISVLNGSSYGQDIDSENNSIAYDNITDLLSMKSDDGSIFLSELKKKYSENIQKKDINSDTVPQEKNEEEEQNKIKVSNQDTMRISTLLSGFDDLENDDFSLKKENKSNEQIPWYMGKSAVKSEYIKKSTDSLNKKNKHTVDLKSGYSKYINDANSTPSDKKTISKKKNIPKVRITGRKFKRIKKQSAKKINSEKTFLKSVLSDEHLESAVNEISLNNQKNSLNNTLNENNFKDFPPVPENSCSIMHLYKQNTDPEKTLSRNLVKERFNWKSNIEKSSQEKNDTQDAISKALLKNKINLPAENN